MANDLGQCRLTARRSFRPRRQPYRSIDEKHEKSLRSFAKDLRNKYSHFNIQKITKDAVFEQVKQKDIETGEEKIVSLPASASPAFQIIAKEILDERKMMKVFAYADRVVQNLFAKLSTR